MNPPVRILVVCTANICRSVMAETYLRLEAERRGLDVELSSSGFLTNGDAASDAVRTVMGERGIDVAAHRSRITTPAIVDDADLVVTMERRHGRDIAAMARARAVFTLLGAVDGLTRVSVEVTDPIERIAAAEHARLDGDLLSSGSDEIDDPFGKSLRVNRKTADRLLELSAALLHGLFGPAEAQE